LLTGLHSVGFVVILVAAGAYAVTGLVTARSGRSQRWAYEGWIAFLALVVAQGLVGVAIAVTSGGPAEAIHWVYGGAILLVLLIGNGVAVNMLPGKRGQVMTLMAALVAVLAWRLSQTG
jgi:hypothetical protein